MQPQMKEIKVSKNFRITFCLIILCVMLSLLVLIWGGFMGIFVSHDPLGIDTYSNFSG